MNIGIIGSGNVGGTLGTRWAQAGHKIAFVSRDSASPAMKALVERAGPNARAASAEEAAAASEVLLFATPWAATESAIASAGDLTGKIVIDATNPLHSDLSGLLFGTTTSAAEKVQLLATGAKVVKAFNTIGYNIMADPKFGGDKPVLFYCGDHADANEVAKQLAADLGFDPVDAGPLTQARVLEPFAMLWISLAHKAGLGTDIAFKLLRR